MQDYQTCQDYQTYIDFDPEGDGGLLIALAFRAVAENEWAGVCILNNREQETLFHLRLDDNGEPEHFLGTTDLNPWDGFRFNYLNIQREFDAAAPMAEELAEMLESMTADFLQDWFWIDDGEHDTYVLQYEHLGLQTHPLNVLPTRLQDMDYCEDEAGSGTTWFEHRAMQDDIVAQILEEYI